MDDKTKVAVAIVGGYVLGRTKQGRLALTVAGVVAGRRMGLDPRELVTEGVRRLGEIPQVEQLQQQLRAEGTDAARKAVSAVAERGIGSLADAISARAVVTGERQTESGDDSADDTTSEDEEQEADQDEHEGDYEDSDEEEEGDQEYEDQDEQGGEEERYDEEEDEDQGGDGEDEPAEPKAEPAKKAARTKKAAPAKRTEKATKKAPPKKATKKPPTKTGKKAPAKKARPPRENRRR